MTNQIRVYTRRCVSYCDLPSPIDTYVSKVCDEYGISSGESIDFMGVLEYYESINDDESKAYREVIDTFMKQNDLDDEINIDLDW